MNTMQVPTTLPQPAQPSEVLSVLTLIQSRGVGGNHLTAIMLQNIVGNYVKLRGLPYDYAYDLYDPMVEPDYYLSEGVY